MNADQVITRLHAADRAWQKERASVLLLRHFKWPVIAFVALIVADIVFHLLARQRLVLGVGFVAAIVLAMGSLMHFAWLKTNPLERIARLLESRSPELGSKLINLLHLREKFITLPHASPTLSRR